MNKTYIFVKRGQPHYHAYAKTLKKIKTKKKEKEKKDEVLELK